MLDFAGTSLAQLAIKTSTAMQMFYDGFTADKAGGAAAGWVPINGAWSTCQPRGHSMKYCETSPNGMALPAIPGQTAWTDYIVDASLFRAPKVPAGRIMIMGRVVDSNHYYDLEMRSNIAGSNKLWWYIGKQDGALWTKIAGGALTPQSNPYYTLRLAFSGDNMSAYVSYNYSPTFVVLGSGTDSSYPNGGIGLQSLNMTSGMFDSVRVTGNPAAPTAPPSAAPSASPAPPSGTVVWQAGNAQLGRYETASDFQCGKPVNNGASFTFDLVQNGQNCGRNQAQPMLGTSGDLVRLNEGQQYTFTFDYIDGTPSDSGPGMGYDQLADALILQLHPYGGGNPCFGLEFDNGGINKYTGGPQEWTMTNCDGTVWAGTYMPRERDHWQISVFVSQTSSGFIDAYRNGTHLGHWSGAVYTNAAGGSGGPWFNFGPYKSRWELSNAGGSTLKEVNATLNNLTLTTP